MENTTSIKKATKEDWINTKLESFYEVTWNRKFTSNEYESLKLGSIPQCMEHKWFIYEEDNVIYFHRSWTGTCIYQLILNPVLDQHLVRININPTEYKAESTDLELQKLEFIIQNIRSQYNIFLVETAAALKNSNES